MAGLGAIPNVWFRALGQYRLMAHVVSNSGSTQSHDVVAICSGRDRAQGGLGEPSQAKTPPVSLSTGHPARAGDALRSPRVTEADGRRLRPEGPRQAGRDHAWMHADYNRLRSAACDLDRERSQDLNQRRLRGPVGVPAALSVVADRSDPRRQGRENASLPPRQQGHECLVH